MQEKEVAILQQLAWLAAFATFVFGLYKFVAEQKLSREQRELELKWKKVNIAREILNEFVSSYRSKSAMRMLDSVERDYELTKEHTATISQSDVLRVLRDSNIHSAEAIFIRDSFDSFFYRLGVFEHFINEELIEFKSIKFPTAYYVLKLAENKGVYERYMIDFHFDLGMKFLNRFNEWKTASTTNS